MSYDLFFYVRAGERLDPVRWLEYVAAQPHMTLRKRQADAGHQAWYQHPSSGAYCSFDLSTEELGPLPEELGQDFAETGLSFNLNYVRGTFFALESMPLVEAMANEFGLLTVDPQAHSSNDDAPRVRTASELIDTWRAGNQFAV